MPSFENTDPRLMLLAPGDSVYVLRDQIAAGETIHVEGRDVRQDRALGLGHKIARVPHAPGDKVIKYGAPLGTVTRAIKVGDHVHTHNLRSDYTATHTLDEARDATEGSK